MSEYPEEVTTLVNRLAAAFMRGDAAFARELVNDERLGWEEAGRDKEVTDRQKTEQLRLEYEGRANALFVTKDGLEVVQVIEVMQVKSGFQYPPAEWKRPCERKNYAPMAKDADMSFEPIPIRRYRYEGQRRDGLPVFKEV